MKQTLLLLLLAISTGLLPSCKEVNTEGKAQVLQDSMINIFPNWQALKVWVDDNNTEIDVVMCDKSMYSAPAAEQKQKADALAKMIVRIYGMENYLTTGKLILTMDANNTAKAPADGVTILMDIAAEKKATEKK